MILIFVYINDHFFETLKKLSWKLKPSNVCMPFALYFLFSIFYSTYYVHSFLFQIFFHTAPYLHRKSLFLGLGVSGNCPYGVDLVKKLVFMLQSVLWSCGSIRISFSRRTPDKVQMIMQLVRIILPIPQVVWNQFWLQTMSSLLVVHLFSLVLAMACINDVARGYTHLSLGILHNLLSLLMNSLYSFF